MKQYKPFPSPSEIHFNIKFILWNEQPKTFDEFRNKYSSIFTKRVIAWLKKHNRYNRLELSKIWSVMFYYGFVNFQRENAVKTHLERCLYTVLTSSLGYDAGKQVDLIAFKESQLLYIQVKPKNGAYNFAKLLKACRKDKAKPILAVPNGSYNFNFYDISNGLKQIIL